MRDRYKAIGNTFHAGVMKHIMKCCQCISDMAMSGVVTRDDVRRQEVPFTENKDHVEPGGLWAEFIQERVTVEVAALQSRDQSLQGLKLQTRAAGASVEGQGLLGLWSSSPWGVMDTLDSGAGGQGVTPSPAVEAAAVWAAVKVEQDQQLVPVPRGVQVKVKLEPGTGLTPRDEGLSNRKRRLAAHMMMTAGRAQVPAHHKRPKGLMALMDENWDEKEHCPVLQHVGWSRKRAIEMPTMPEDPTERAEFALELADAYTLRPNEKATWKAYSEWWKTYLSFCEFFDVAETNSVGRLPGRVELAYGWEESVEALR